MIADVREVSMAREYRLFIVDARASADTFRRSLCIRNAGWPGFSARRGGWRAVQPLTDLRRNEFRAPVGARDSDQEAARSRRSRR